MQDRLVEHRLASHGVEHALQQTQEALALFRDDAEANEVGDWHVTFRS